MVAFCFLFFCLFVACTLPLCRPFRVSGAGRRTRGLSMSETYAPNPPGTDSSPGALTCVVCRLRPSFNGAGSSCVLVSPGRSGEGKEEHKGTEHGKGQNKIRSLRCRWSALMRYSRHLVLRFAHRKVRRDRLTGYDGGTCFVRVQPLPSPPSPSMVGMSVKCPRKTSPSRFFGIGSPFILAGSWGPRMGFNVLRGFVFCCC